MREIIVMRTGNTINMSFTLPKPLAELLDRVCEEDSRNRSELLREALRSYFKTRTLVPGLVTTNPDDRRKRLTEAAYAVEHDPEYADARAISGDFAIIASEALLRV